MAVNPINPGQKDQKQKRDKLQTFADLMGIGTALASTYSNLSNSGKSSDGKTTFIFDLGNKKKMFEDGND